MNQNKINNIQDFLKKTENPLRKNKKMCDFTSKEILKDKNFIKKIKKSIKYLYEKTNMITLYSENNKTIKGIIDQSSPQKAYYIIKEDNRYSLYYSLIYAYVLEAQKTEKNILSHSLIYGGIEKTKNIESLSAFPILKHSNSYYNLDFKIPSEIKDMQDKEILNYLNECKKSYRIDITKKLSFIQDYINFYSSYKNNFKISEKKLESYTKISCINYLPKIKNISKLLNFLNQFEQFTDKNPFNYNDLDNKIWKQDKYILINNQNIIYICKFTNHNNFKIHSIIIDAIPENERKEERVEKIIKNFDNLSKIQHNLISFENGKITYIDDFLYSDFELDIVCGVDAITESFQI